ncbi:serine protease Do [Albimonas donghaensis]|uniref:Probable periplasmic serine endoprotease DegP-like n=1 Tax=Albimonas donghaensis TaxID=356660 RepID=A0A1H2SFT3_9RHOB|nr:DegQ family serine endoprotease [Albimonas donghaensis]SDW29849.1 serine protease Do [Albimonas donghaensis]
MQIQPHTDRRRPLTATLAMAAVAAGALLAFQPAPQANAQQAQPPSTGQQLGGPQPAGAPTSFADLAERLSPAVVNISTTTKVAQPDRPRGPNLPENSPFRELFPELFGENGPGGGGGPARPRGSLGSGFVISADGYLVTNNHVIDGADEIKANFSDGRSLTAELIGTDPKTDVALLKVEPDHPLDFVDFGDSDGIRVGDWVLAIGNPFGLGGSVSAGIISARNRDINAGPYDDFLQTDAAINRGNSGGPLFDMAGNVIGVNTAIISPSGGSIGIGFAVPSTIVENVVDQLREFGTTKRGWLGVSIQEVTPDIAEGLGLDKPAGALISTVIDEGPAKKSGLRNGDVILRFDGQVVEQMRDLPRMVAETKAGKVVPVEVWRKGDIETVDVTLGLLEEDAPVINASADAPSDPSPAAEALGMTLKAIDPQARAEYSLGDEVEGVLVESVDAAGPAAEKGMRPGDVIVEVAQESVSTPAEVKDRVEKAGEQGRKSVLLLVSSRGELRFIAVSLEE